MDESGSDCAPGRPLKVGTHSGSFHADEVFALATLTIACGPIDVVRTRDPELLATCDLRVDVGRRYDPGTGDFDHHQGDAGERENGVRYASFGLIWQEYGERACGSKEVADELDGSIVAPIDAGDNGQELTESNFEGVSPYTLGRLISQFSPLWDEEDQEAALDAGFRGALDTAERIVRREVEQAQARARAGGIVRDAIARAEDPRIVELDRGLPWKSVLIHEAPEALIVVYPREKDWGVQAVPADRGTFENRKDLPESWAGLEGDELVAASGVEGAIFCHVGRFMAVAADRESAMTMARLAVDA